MDRNRYLEAFKESFNVLGLSAAVAASAALLSPLPLLVGLVAEAAYILFVSDSRWYQVRLAQRFDQDIEKRRAELKMRVMPTLQPAMQQRFTQLEAMRASINDQAESQPEWFREVLRKLDFLLEKFLHFAAKDAQFRQYLESILLQEYGTTDVSRFGSNSNSNNAPNINYAQNTPHQSAAQLRSSRGLAGTLPTSVSPTSVSPTSATGSSSRLKGQVPNPPAPVNSHSNGGLSNGKSDGWTQAAIAQIQAHYDRELDDLKTNAQNESDANTRAVLEKRLDVLGRRREFIGKIGRIQTNLLHQLSLLEDTFGLISDEIRAQPPEQVLADINDVVSQTNTMTQLLEDFAPFENNLNI